MSGSPVYADDGRLIGAVAYGLSWGPSPIGGVTPFEDMDDYLAAAPAANRVTVDGKTARTIAEHSDVTQTQAREGFSQLRMPLGMSGVSSARLAQAARVDKPYAPKDVYSIGRADGAAAGPESIVAGGNLAASVSYGDVTLAGVGTATSVCAGRVVGFGHPLAFLGETTLSLHPANALFIQPESLGAPFKLANLGAPTGTITDDRLAGITGSFGDTPDAADITSTVSYDGRSRTGETHVTVPAFMADGVFGQFLSNHDRVLDGVVDGTEVQEWTITGTRADGSPFDLTYADRYTSSDVTFGSVFELADLVYSLGIVPGVTIDSVTVDSDVDDETGAWEVSSMEQRRGGAWGKITRKNPAVAKAGKVLLARAVLTGPEGTTMVPVRFVVPKKAAGSKTVLNVSGGSDLFTGGWATSVADAEKMVDSAVRNDEVQVQYGTRNAVQGGSFSEGDFPFFRGRRPSFVKSKVLGPLDKVVTGSKQVKVLVK